MEAWENMNDFLAHNAIITTAMAAAQNLCMWILWWEHDEEKAPECVQRALRGEPSPELDGILAEYIPKIY